MYLVFYNRKRIVEWIGVKGLRVFRNFSNEDMGEKFFGV